MKLFSCLLVIASFFVTNLSAEEDIKVCAMVVPSSAALRADGKLGISFYTDESENYFQNIAPTEATEECYGHHAVNLMLNACSSFIAEHTSKSIVEDCSVKDQEIEKLKRANKRLKNQLRRSKR